MILYTIGDFFLQFQRIKRRVLYYAMRCRFKAIGKNFKFCPENSKFIYETISIGDNVQIGEEAIFMSSESEIIIGNHIMFGPRVTIIGGNHNISIVGEFMTSVREKRPSDDETVIIEDDVWVGANSTILKGVTIGRGSVVAAGAVVTNSCPPYSIIGGVPARLIKWRWSVEKIIEHENKLYPIENRSNIGMIIKERESLKKE